MGESVRIAAITDDGVTISQHFGRAAYYLVYTYHNGEIVDRELREKLGHTQFAAEAGQQDHAETHGHESETRHGYGAAARSKHERMAAAILDCQALLCRGMGHGAYESMQEHNIQPIVTDIRDIEEAVVAYVDQTIVDHTERLH